MKGFLVGAGAAAVLLALAYQLVRTSESGVVSAPSTKIERVAPRAQEAPLRLPATAAASIPDYADPRPASGPAPYNPGQGAASQAAAGQAPASFESDRSGGGSERAAVAAYFDAIDHIQPGTMSGGGESVAQEMAAALAGGDTSSLDKMIRETEAAKARLAAITPPAPCATHYRESLGSLDDALEVLRSLKAAMQSSEPVAQLTSVASRAAALQSRASVLQKEEAALRERYGVKPPAAKRANAYPF